MPYDAEKTRLYDLIQADTGIKRIRNLDLQTYAQERAAEIKSEIDPYNPSDPPLHNDWSTYWPKLPAGITAFGENLTWNYQYLDPVAAAQTGWKNSAHHWSNETNTTFTQIGLGVERLSVDSTSLNDRWYFVALYTNTPTVIHPIGPITELISPIRSYGYPLFTVKNDPPAIGFWAAKNVGADDISAKFSGIYIKGWTAGTKISVDRTAKLLYSNGKQRVCHRIYSGPYAGCWIDASIFVEPY